MLAWSLSRDHMVLYNLLMNIKSISKITSMTTHRLIGQSEAVVTDEAGES